MKSIFVILGLLLVVFIVSFICMMLVWDSICNKIATKIDNLKASRRKMVRDSNGEVDIYHIEPY